MLLTAPAAFLLVDWARGWRVGSYGAHKWAAGGRGCNGVLFPLTFLLTTKGCSKQVFLSLVALFWAISVLRACRNARPVQQ